MAEERPSKQVSVSIPLPLLEVLQVIADKTNKSVSSLCLGIIEDGIYSEIEKQSKLQVFLEMQEKAGLKSNSE